MIRDSTYFSQRHGWRPLGMSLIVHSLFMLLIILWCFSEREPSSAGKLRRGGIVLTLESADRQPEYLDEQDISKDLEAESQPPPLSASTASSESMPSIALEFDKIPDRVGFLPAESLVLDANRMATVPANSAARAEYQLTAEDLKLIEADQKLIQSRQPVGEPVNISVFGSGILTGRSFVFVLDRSKSMGEQGLGVIAASRKQLSGAINQLESHHQFQIVGYHDRTVTMSARRLLDATEANKRQVASYIGNLVAFGGTQHENGLVVALAFRPDVIVLMTDGGYPELNAGQLKLIQKMAGEKTEIHCIQFGIGPLQTRPNFMTRLADQNRGRFQYIDVNHWKK